MAMCVRGFNSKEFSLLTKLSSVRYLGCAERNRPGVYTSTAYHFDYIKNEVCNHPNTDKTISLCGGGVPSNNANMLPSNNADKGVAAPQCATKDAPCNENMPCCESTGSPLECKRIRGEFQCATPSRPERESIGKSSGSG
jgi:hypothetical protein